MVILGLSGECAKVSRLEGQSGVGYFSLGRWPGVRTRDLEQRGGSRGAGAWAVQQHLPDVFTMTYAIRPTGHISSDPILLPSFYAVHPNLLR